MADNQRMTNWRPAAEGGPIRAPLLQPSYQGHASQVAAAVRHVVASTCDKTPQSADAPMMAAAAPPPQTFPDMSQPMTIPRGDSVRSLPTLKHILRKAPITPEWVLASIQQASPGAT